MAMPAGVEEDVARLARRHPHDSIVRRVAEVQGPSRGRPAVRILVRAVVAHRLHHLLSARVTDVCSVHGSIDANLEQVHAPEHHLHLV
jgi:hypothetical protein